MSWNAPPSPASTSSTMAEAPRGCIGRQHGREDLEPAASTRARSDWPTTRFPGERHNQPRVTGNRTAKTHARRREPRPRMKIPCLDRFF
jgi:hypothetical protein